MDRSKYIGVSIPSTIWERFENRRQVIQIKLKSGQLLNDILVEKDGAIIGYVVGGQDGIVELGDKLKSEEIIAIRSNEGFLGRLGFTKWIRV